MVVTRTLRQGINRVATSVMEMDRHAANGGTLAAKYTVQSGRLPASQLTEVYTT